MILEILKIKSWMIKFKIDDHIYFIKSVDDLFESGKQLFEYIPVDNKGHYKTECLAGSYGDLNVSDFVTMKRGQTYKQIDLCKFWAALAWFGFGEAVGMSKDNIEWFKRQHRIIVQEEKVKKAEEQLETERLKLSVLKRTIEEEII